MNVNKININQSELSYDIASDIYDKATDFTKTVASISVVTGTEVTADETLSETCILSTGRTFSNYSYTTKKYNVAKGQKFKIKGRCRGTKDVACYAFYNNIEISSQNLVYVYTIADFVGGDFSGSQIAMIDHFIDIPDGVVMVAVVNVTNEGNNAMYNFVNTKDYVDAEKNRAIIAEQANANTITNEETRAKAAEQVNTKMIFNAASISVILGSKIEPDEILEGKVISNGNTVAHNKYAVRRYTVTSGQKLKVKGSVRGTKDVACYALYNSDEIVRGNLFSTYTIGDFAGNDLVGSTTVEIERYIEIPEGVTTLATCSTEVEKLIMLAYDVKNTKDYVDVKLRKIKYVDCLGDSLTMGATRFGWYEDTLQELLGDEYKVRNWGVGGESSGSIMARQGSDCIKFQEDWVLKADKSTTLVMNNDGHDILIKTQKYNTVVSLLLQGAENDTEQKTRVVNPCYINGVECTMTYTQGSAFAKGSWYINRNQTGERDITIPANTPIYFNTCKEMGKSEITIIWMGTNDGNYSDWQTLVDKQIMASNKVSNKKFIVIGLHKIGGTIAKTYESLMRNAFGNKFFNIREYACSNMIYDAGITPTEDDLTNMANGICPSSLLYDSTHFNPKSNVAIGRMIYNIIVGLGYI